MEISVIKKVRKVVEEAVKETINVTYPTENKYYKMQDDGFMFPRGTVIFAIVIKHSRSFLLFEIEKGKQFYTDFVPTKDCHDEDFITSKNSIRRTALSLMLGKNKDFIEISEKEFLKSREGLLDVHILDSIGLLKNKA